MPSVEWAICPIEPNAWQQESPWTTADRVAVLVRHGVEVDDPLFSVLAGARTRVHLTVRDGLARYGLAKAPGLADVRGRHEAVEGRCRLHSDAPQLVAGKVQLVVPDDAASALIHTSTLPNSTSSSSAAKAGTRRRSSRRRCWRAVRSNPDRARWRLPSPCETSRKTLLALCKCWNLKLSLFAAASR